MPIAGGATTVMDAVAVFPVPAVVEVTVTMLFSTAALVPVTFTETVHDALSASVPPDKLTDPNPPTAVTVPPQLPLTPLGVSTTRPAGKESVNATSASATSGMTLICFRLSSSEILLAAVYTFKYKF